MLRHTYSLLIGILLLLSAATLRAQPNSWDVRGISGGDSTQSIAWSSPHDMFVGCLNVSAIRSSDSGKTFSFDWIGLGNQQEYINDVSFVLRHPNGKLYACEGEVPGSSGDYTDMPVGLSGGRLMVSADSGKTWSVVKDFSAPTLWMTLDPDNSNHAYVAVSDTGNGNGGIWECDDLITNSSWKKLPAPPRTQGRAIQIHIKPDFKYLVAVYGARDSMNNHFTKSSGVFTYNTNTNSWIDNTPVGAEYDVRDFAYSPEGEHWFVSVGGLGGLTAAGLYHSGPGINGKVNEMPGVIVKCATVVDGGSDDYIAYISTENDGLYYAHDFQIDTVKSYPFRSPGRVFLNPYKRSEVWVTSNGYGLAVGKYIPTDSTPSVTILISPSADDTLKTLSPTFVWHSSKNASFYRITIYTDAAGSKKYDSKSVSDTTVSFQYLPYDSTFWWSVEALNGVLTVPSNEIRKFRTVRSVSALLISPPNNTTGLETSVTLVWQRVENAEKYILQVSETPVFASVLTDTLSDTTRVVDGLLPSTTYYWKVKPLSSDSLGVWSGYWKFSIKNVPVTQVILATPKDSAVFPVTDTNTTYRNFTWISVIAATNYQIQVSYSPFFDSLIADDTTSGKFEHLVKLFFEDTTYYWRVRAYNELGWGEWSDTRQLSHKIINSVRRDEKHDIVVFPNPATRAVTITGSSLVSGAKLELVNLLGEVLKREDVVFANTEATLSLDEIPSGTYYLLIKPIAGKLMIVKVIKE